MKRAKKLLAILLALAMTATMTDVSGITAYGAPASTEDVVKTDMPAVETEAEETEAEEITATVSEETIAQTSVSQEETSEKETPVGEDSSTTGLLIYNKNNENVSDSLYSDSAFRINSSDQSPFRLAMNEDITQVTTVIYNDQHTDNIELKLDAINLYQQSSTILSIKNYGELTFDMMGKKSEICGMAGQTFYRKPVFHFRDSVGSGSLIIKNQLMTGSFYFESGVVTARSMSPTPSVTEVVIDGGTLKLPGTTAGTRLNTTNFTLSQGQLDAGTNGNIKVSGTTRITGGGISCNQLLKDNYNLAAAPVRIPYPNDSVITVSGADMEPYTYNPNGMATEGEGANRKAVIWLPTAAGNYTITVDGTEYAFTYSSGIKGYISMNLKASLKLENSDGDAVTKYTLADQQEKPVQIKLSFDAGSDFSSVDHVRLLENNTEVKTWSKDELATGLNFLPTLVTTGTYTYKAEICDGNNNVLLELSPVSIELMADRLVRVGATEYGTLQDAIDNIPHNSTKTTTITLLKDIELTNPVCMYGNATNMRDDKSWTLDLNQHTLSGNNTDLLRYCTKEDAENGTTSHYSFNLTIKNGSLLGSKSLIAGAGYGTLTLSNVYAKGTGADALIDLTAEKSMKLTLANGTRVLCTNPTGICFQSKANEPVSMALTDSQMLHTKGGTALALAEGNTVELLSSENSMILGALQQGEMTGVYTLNEAGGNVSLTESCKLPENQPLVIRPDSRLTIEAGVCLTGDVENCGTLTYGSESGKTDGKVEGEVKQGYSVSFANIASMTVSANSWKQFSEADVYYAFPGENHFEIQLGSGCAIKETPVLTTESGRNIPVRLVETEGGAGYGELGAHLSFSYEQPNENISISIRYLQKASITTVWDRISRAYTGSPVSFSTKKGEDVTWDGEGTLTYGSYYMFDTGKPTYERNTGGVEGSAPCEAGEYYVEATVTGEGDYLSNTVMIPFRITPYGAEDVRIAAIKDRAGENLLVDSSHAKMNMEQACFIKIELPEYAQKDGALKIYMGGQCINSKKDTSVGSEAFSPMSFRDLFGTRGGSFPLTIRYQGDSNIADFEETIIMEIAPASVENATMNILKSTCLYSGTPQMAKPDEYNYKVWFPFDDALAAGASNLALYENEDYEIEYQNNVDAYTLDEDREDFDPELAPAVIVKGINGFTGSRKFFFMIQKAESSILTEQTAFEKTLGDADFSLGCTVSECGVPDGALQYNVSDGRASDGSSKTASDILTVDESGMATIHGSGSVTVTVEKPESKNHLAAESKTITVQVNKVSGIQVKAVPAVTYTGKAVRPEVVVLDGDTERVLTAGKEYTVTYKNNVKASTGITDAAKKPMILVKGKGSYTGSRTVSFDILPCSLSENAITAGDLFTEQNGKVQKKAPVVAFNSKKLKENTDYTVSFSTEPKENGVYDITLTGIGNFTGSKIVKLTIADKGMLLTKATVKVVKSKPYQNGTPVTLSGNELVVTTKVSGKKVTLTEGTDYTVSYENNTNAGKATVTVTGKGAYAGSKSAAFTITGTSFKKAKVAGLADKAYTGAAITQSLSVNIADKTTPGGVKTLTEGTDYTVSYENNVKAGKATVVLSGTGAYTGQLKKKFKITAGTIEGAVLTGFDVSGNSVSMDAVYAAYEKQGVKPAIELTVSGDLLTEGTDYTVTYKNNKAVTTTDTRKLPTIFIKGRGNYAGKLTQTFVITEKELNNPADPVAMRVADRVVSTKAGGYISIPVVNESSTQKLKAGKDFDVIYKKADGTVLTKTDTAAAGDVITATITGKGSYTGTLTTTYRITERDFTKVKAAALTKAYSGEIVVLKADDFVKADGSSVITYKNSSATESLVYGTDFTVVPGSYVNNEKVGKATVTIKGLGRYGGEKTISFVITKRNL